MINFWEVSSWPSAKILDLGETDIGAGVVCIRESLKLLNHV